MAKFKKGDRVQVVKVSEYDDCASIKVGDKGAVVHVDGGSIGVRMDKYNEILHCCTGYCEDGHGRYFVKDQLELIENETPEPSPEVPEYTMDELTKKLGHEFKIKK